MRTSYSQLPLLEICNMTGAPKIQDNGNTHTIIADGGCYLQLLFDELP
jgi:hypothetical protein